MENWDKNTIAQKLAENKDLKVDKSVNAYVPIEEAAKKTKLENHVPLPRSHPEDDFASAFDDLATLCHWTWCGFHPARVKVDGEDQYRTPVIGQKGLPDRILARDGVVLLVELKAEEGKLSKDQKVWESALCGYTGYYVVRPSDWGRIVEMLE